MDTPVLGRDHPLVRRLRRLRRDRGFRDAEGILVAEGVHLAQEALRAKADVEFAVVSPSIDRVAEGRDLRAQLVASGFEPHVVSDELLETLQDARSPQPVLLVVRHPRIGMAAVLAGRSGTPLIVVAHGIQDPGNLGAIARTADASSATGLLATGNGADLFHPRTVRATMGSIFRLPAAHADLDSAIEHLRRRAIRIVGADRDASRPLDGCDLRLPVALVLGSEGAGVADSVLRRLDEVVRIPMRPEVESLSVGAAAAVLLYEAVRQRGTP